MKKYLARDHRFYINDGTNWLAISGVSSWSMSVANDVQDNSKFSNNGWSSAIITSRAGAITLEGFYLVDAVTGTRDQGQLACETAAKSLGFHALRGFKLEAYTNNTVIGSIQTSGIISFAGVTAGAQSVLPWNTSVEFLGIPIGSGIYNIFDQEAYPPPEPDISRSGMWTGVLGMYTYAE